MQDCSAPELVMQGNCSFGGGVCWATFKQMVSFTLVMPLDLALTSGVVLSLLLAAVRCWVVGVVEAISWRCMTTAASVCVSGVCVSFCNCV